MDRGRGASGFLDLRENPRFIERIEPARAYAPLRNFLAALNDRDSLLFTARCKTTRTEAGPASAGGPEFIVHIELAFATPALNRDRAPFEQLASQVQELLTRESGSDSLCLELFLRKCNHAEGGAGFCLALELHAQAATPEQAELRCGLGLSRVQQALLFSSRALRQKLGDSN